MTDPGDDILDQLQDRLGYRFTDLGLLGRSLTHSSAAAEQAAGGRKTYQRLEFLGDRVLALVVADMLLSAFPEAAEGELARRLTGLVRNEACADVARELQLGEAVILGAGEAASGGRSNAAILGDVCEAVIGAVYRDGGLSPAAALIERHWRPRMLNWSRPLHDAKSTLQEWAQGRGLPTPAYVLVERSGPHHRPSFVVEVTLAGVAPARGEGRSKRDAEQNAAAEMLVREGIWKAEGP